MDLPSLFRLRLTAVLMVLPRPLLAEVIAPQSPGSFLATLSGLASEIEPGLGVAAVVALAVLVIALRAASAIDLFEVEFRQNRARAAMAWLVMPAPGGSARSGALRAAAGGRSHALPAAAPALPRGAAAGTGAPARGSSGRPPFLI